MPLRRPARHHHPGVRLELKNLLRRYETYWRQNRTWLLRDVPRRASDLRVYEAVYHFNLYMYLQPMAGSWLSVRSGWHCLWRPWTRPIAKKVRPSTGMIS